MPDAFELPGMLRAVVPHMSGERFPGLRGGVVHKLVALAFGRSLLLSALFARRCPWLNPSLAAVIGALNNLPKPATCLRRKRPIRGRGPSVDGVNRPSGKVGTADVPVLALAV